MSSQRRQFTALSRLLHWTMAAMVLTMLCIGVAMVASLANYHVLVSIHRPLGIAILILVVVRFVNRQLTSLPPFPASAHTPGYSLCRFSQSVTILVGSTASLSICISTTRPLLSIR